MQPTSPAWRSRWPSWLRPRFGLGALLLLVTLCAVGAWYWWRLPFEVERTGLHVWRGLELVIVERMEKPSQPAPSRAVASFDPFAAPGAASPPSPASSPDPFAGPVSASKASDSSATVQPQLKRRVISHQQIV